MLCFRTNAERSACRVARTNVFEVKTFHALNIARSSCQEGHRKFCCTPIPSVYGMTRASTGPLETRAPIERRRTFWLENFLFLIPKSSEKIVGKKSSENVVFGLKKNRGIYIYTLLRYTLSITGHAGGGCSTRCTSGLLKTSILGEACMCSFSSREPCREKTVVVVRF